MKTKILCVTASTLALLALCAPSAVAAENSPGSIKPPPGGRDYGLSIRCKAPTEYAGIPNYGYAYNANGDGFPAGERIHLVTKVYRHGSYTGTEQDDYTTAGPLGIWSTNTHYGPIDTGGVSIHGTVYSSSGTALVSSSSSCTTYG